MTREPGSEVSRRWVRWRKSIDLDEYDRRWDDMIAQGKSVHGELDFIERLEPGRRLRILDAGCGTGRLAIEAVRRGHSAIGVDLDPDMIARARSKNDEITWLCADLSRLALDEMFDVAVMAGNIPLFCAPGTQSAIIASLARHLVDDGSLVCGFSIEKSAGSYTADLFEEHARRAGFGDVQHFANWDGDPVTESNGDYAVIVCRRS